MSLKLVSNRSTPRVVIIGAGFGGLACARGLAGAAAEVTIIDRQNHHLFQPLLYEVATAGLSPADIATPVRSLVRDQKNVTVLLDEVVDIDTDRHPVVTKARRIGYDFLIIATGAVYSFFGRPQWQNHTICLKSLGDALKIRRRILSAFERAEASDDKATQDRNMTIAIVGAGPTGVEMAGAAAELCKRALARDFRRIDPTSARILLVEAGPRILAAFPSRLSDYARRALEHLGVEVVTGQAVEDINEKGIVVGGAHIDASTVIWSAGVEVPFVSGWLRADADRSGRILVADDLSVPGQTNVFVIGDAAHLAGANGLPLPGVAPVAKQQGKFVAELIRRRLDGDNGKSRFRYRDYGNLATIGRSAAVLDLGWVKITGWFAWLLWSVAHIYFLIGARNRLSVFLNWMWAYVTFGRGARLIINKQDKETSPRAHSNGENRAA